MIIWLATVPLIFISLLPFMLTSIADTIIIVIFQVTPI